ncbi:MAG: efflux RND transporter periplasmic adaptor subunit [Terracidiphilus sp.]|jgi:cobalt-zinc-cadmium efflux system membrane fusion protein
MTTKSILLFSCFLAACISFTACKKEINPADGAPPATQIIPSGDMSLVSVDKPDLFPLVAAETHEAPAEMNVTGAVFPDVAREIPVISLANGRVVDIKARLDDYVKKGDLLIKVQSPDVAGAFDVYLKAVNDERMNNLQYQRSQVLFDHGAISQTVLEQAEDAEKDSQADLAAAEQSLKILGVDPKHPSEIVNVYAPISGVIIAQNVTQAAAAGVNLSGSATAFTIADLTSVWVVCDVYENDIPKIALGQTAQLHLTAYPDKVLTGRVSDIGPVLDPNIRTAKVRLEIPNPGNILKLGMFVTATFHGRTKEKHPVVSADAVLHLHDRDWVFIPAPNSQFKRVEVQAGKILPGNKQEILSGINPGQQVVSNVLQLEATLEAQ